MVKGCAVVDCHMGHGSEKKLPDGIAMHSFPDPIKDADRRREWIKNIGRDNFKPTKHMGVCSLHFTPQSQSGYRQTHGGNFLVGVQQILQSEKKLRAITLLKYAGCSVSDLRALKDVDAIRNATAQAIAKDLTPKIDAHLNSAPSDPNDPDKNPNEPNDTDKNPNEPNDTDQNIVLYVCGAMVHSHLNSTKGCGPCQRLLLNNGTREQMPDLTTEGSIPESAAAFVEQVNRGGLLIPSSLVFGLGLKCWKVFECIRNDPDLRAAFLKATNHRTIFVEVMLNLLNEESEIEDVLVNELTCADGHQFGRILVAKYFNCMCKNWIKEMSVAVKPSERKIAKFK